MSQVEDAAAIVSIGNTADGGTKLSGGSYGGLGGVGQASGAPPGVPNAVYGDFRNPNEREAAALG